MMSDQVSELVEAALSGSLEDVTSLIENGVPVNQKDEFNWTAAYAASYGGQLNVLKHLVERGADLHIRCGKYNPSCLHIAAASGSVPVAAYLLEQGLQVDVADNNGFSPLFKAAINNHSDMVKWLLEKGANKDAQNVNGFTPIMQASQEGHFSMVQLLAAQGANVRIKSEVLGHTCLSAAGLSQNTDLIAWLISEGFDVNHNIQQPLAEIYNNLLKKDVNVVKIMESQSTENLDTFQGCTPMILAAIGGHLPAIQLLQKNGADIHNVCDIIGLTALTVACIGDHSEMVSWLLEQGLQVNHKTKAGMSPIHVCAIQGNLNTAKLLMNKGADLKASTNQGMTALMLALENKNDDMVNFLSEQMGLTEGDIDEVKQSANKIKEQLSGLKPPAINWMPEEVQTLVNTCNINAIFIGDKLSGKTSLARSLVTNTQYLAEGDDRTVVLNNLHLRLPDNKIINIQDLGGHASYRNTAPFYISNSSTNLIHLCHDITSVEYHTAYYWLHETISRAPKSQLRFVLTKTDQIPTQNISSRKQGFITALKGFISQEVASLEIKKVRFANSNKSIHIEDLLHKYNTLSNNLHDNVFTTSTVPGKYYSTTILKDSIIKFSKAPENLVQIPEIYTQFFDKIGMLGSKPIEKERETKSPNLQLPFASTESYVSDQSHKMKQHQTAKDQSEIHTSESHQEGGFASINQPLQPESFLLKQQQDITIDEQKKPYISYVEGQQIFKTLEQKLYGTISSDETSFRKCLQYFHNIGFVRWFQGNDNLESVIFNDLEEFSSVIKAIFRHNNDEKLDFKRLDASHKELFHSKPHKFQKSLSDLHEQCIMSPAVLKTLLHVNGCTINDDIVRDILLKLGVAFSFVSSKHEHFLLIPYFSEDRPMPPEVIKMDSLKACTSEEITFEIDIEGNLPRVYYTLFLVKFIQKIYKSSDTQERIMWSHGFYATTGNCTLLLNYDGRKVIQIVIKGLPKHLPPMWAFLKDIASKSEELKKELLPGLIDALMFKCPHCKLINASSVHQWDFEELLDDSFVEKCVCKKTGESIPGELVHPVGEVDDLAIKRVSEYLHKTALQHKPRENDIVLQTWVSKAEATMHVTPVLVQLMKRNVITTEDKLNMDKHDEVWRIKYLLQKVQQKDVDILKECLFESGYHTNVTLANLIPIAGTSPTETQYGEYLTDEELVYIRKNFYENFQDCKFQAELIINLFQNLALDKYQREEVNVKQTPSSKSFYLLDHVLLRGTYQTVVQFHTALENTGQTELADLLPIRKEGCLQ